MVTVTHTRSTSVDSPKGLTGKLYPDSRISLAYRGVGQQRRSRKTTGDRERWACQQSVTHASAPSKVFKPRGQKGITSYGRRMVRCCAALLEQSRDRRCLTFGTATLPALPEEDMELLLSRWPEVSNRFFEEYGREVVRSGLPWSVVYVTEIQPRRWEQSGKVALHFHWLCPGRHSRRSPWVITPKKCAEILGRVISRVLGYTPDMGAAIRLEVPRGSVVKEVGKYLSKGCQCVADVVRSGKGHLLPKAWWGGTRKLKSAVEQSVIWLDRDECLGLIDRQDSLRSTKRAWVLHHFIDRHDADNLPDQDKKFWVGATFGFNCDRSVLLAFIKTLKLQDDCA